MSTPLTDFEEGSTLLLRDAAAEMLTSWHWDDALFFCSKPKVCIKVYHFGCSYEEGVLLTKVNVELHSDEMLGRIVRLSRNQE